MEHEHVSIVNPLFLCEKRGKKIIAILRTHANENRESFYTHTHVLYILLLDTRTHTYTYFSLNRLTHLHSQTISETKS